MVSEADRLVEVVGDEDRGLPHHLGELEELVLKLAADQRVERRERLVHQQDLGVGGHGARQSDALAHAAGELVRVAVVPAGEVDEGELLVRDPVALACRHAAQLERQRDVVEHRPVRQEAHVLEDHADLRRAHRPEIGAR